MRYYVLFPNAENIHLVKDVGMIAYKLWENFNVESTVVCYENGSYEYINNHLKGLKLQFIKKNFRNSILDGIAFLKVESKKIDVLQLFHVTLRSVFYAIAYKSFNKSGNIFLKLDCTQELLDKIGNLSGFKKKLFYFYFKKVDIIGVEQQGLYFDMVKLLPKFSEKIQYIPNGIDYSMLNTGNINFLDKENYILQVGRLGSEEKNTQMLIEAFSRSKSMHNNNNNTWKLLLVGDTTEEFRDYLHEFLMYHPELKDSIECTGPIYDRKKLNEIYKKSKIFCLTSHYESFGLVLVEAAACGNVIISTDVGIASELTVCGGEIVKKGGIEALSEALGRYMLSPSLEEICYKNIELIKNNYNWDNIVAELYEKLVSGGNRDE